MTGSGPLLRGARHRRAPGSGEHVTVVPGLVRPEIRAEIEVVAVLPQ
ncbi:hypothetical protein [Streptomyces fagopyri]